MELLEDWRWLQASPGQDTTEVERAAESWVVEGHPGLLPYMSGDPGALLCKFMAYNLGALPYLSGAHNALP